MSCPMLNYAHRPVLHSLLHKSLLFATALEEMEGTGGGVSVCLCFRHFKEGWIYVQTRGTAAVLWKRQLRTQLLSRSCIDSKTVV